MNRIIMLIAVVLLVFTVYWFKFRETPPEAPKQEALVTTRHSAAFNSSIDRLTNEYLKVKEAFVNADTAAAKAATQIFAAQISNLHLYELKTDSNAVFESVQAQAADIKANAESLLQQKDVTEMRQDFRMVSESMYPFLKSVHYEGKVLYWQNCPMAFGDGKEANWISNTKEIVNPYLGKNHPEFKGTMLHCGQVMDSITAH